MNSERVTKSLEQYTRVVKMLSRLEEDNPKFVKLLLEDLDTFHTRIKNEFLTKNDS